MPKIAQPLSDTQIKTAKVSDKEYNLADGYGLYLRVKTNGSKVWIFNYTKPNNKKRTNLGLGTYPELSLLNARGKRQEYLGLLTQNIDPSVHKEKFELTSIERASNTLGKVTEEWFAIKKTSVSENYAQDVYSSLDRHVLPALGGIPLCDLSARQTIEILRPLAAKGSLETVKRICQRLNEIMTYAVNTGLLEVNCLAGISSAFESPKKTNFPTIRPEQLPELVKRIAYSNITLTTRCLIEWQLHTMVRPGEASGTRWDEIDLKNALWSIPPGRMKKKRPHIVPLSKHTLFLLEVMKPIAGHREYVFPADRNPKHHINQQTANMALKRMGYGGTLVAHGLRSLASTVLNEQGFRPDIIEAALAHEDKNSVRAAYNRAEYLDERIEMMQWWSDHISSSQNSKT